MSRRSWTDPEIKQIREERAMGATHNALCLKWQMSPGHLARVLAGTARVEAGGPIQSGMVLDTIVNGMTEAEMALEAKRSGDRVEALLKEQAEREMLPSMGGDGSRAQAYGARLSGHRPVSKPIDVSNVPVSDSGVPLPPDWAEFVSKDEGVVKQSEVDQMIDELMKK